MDRLAISSAFGHPLGEWRESEVRAQGSPPCAFRRHAWCELLTAAKHGEKVVLGAVCVEHQPRARGSTG